MVRLRLFFKYRRVIVGLWGLLFFCRPLDLLAVQPNTFKINPLSPFIGSFTFNYERQLARHYSIQAGGSLMYINILNQDIYVKDTTGTARLVVNGKCYMGSLRWYPLHIPADNNEGLFFELYGRYYDYKITARRIVLYSEQGNHLINNQTYSGKLQNYGLMVGYKLITGKTGFFSHIPVEFSIGPSFNFIELKPDSPGPNDIRIGNGFFSMLTSEEGNRKTGLRFALNVGWLF